MDLYHISLIRLCRFLGMAYSSMRRWRARVLSGLPAVLKPGPKPLEPLDLERFHDEIAALEHRRKRSLGSGHLHETFKNALSRRDIDKHIGTARKEHQKVQREKSKSVHWSAPNLAWSLDDTRFAGKQGHLNTIRDLASRYQFEALSGNLPDGEQIASHLDSLFRLHGAPLILKRDNGSNLNHHKVNELLARWFVIPLNSPPRYPQYNGAIEAAQRDWDRSLDPEDPFTRAHLNTCSRLAAHDLNHKPRAVLGHRSPCAVFHGPGKLHYNKRQRQSAANQIKKLCLEIICSDGIAQSVAWRNAVQNWLLMNNLITIQDHL